MEIGIGRFTPSKSRASSALSVKLWSSVDGMRCCAALVQTNVRFGSIAVIQLQQTLLVAAPRPRVLVDELDQPIERNQ